MTHLFHVNVFYEDTDFAGVVYHANYLKFIERARSNAVLEMGICQIELKSENKFFVVKYLSAKFLKPAYFQDQLKVSTKTNEIKRASVSLKQSIFKDSNKIFSATVQLVLVSCGKPIPFPRYIRENFETLK